MILDSIQKRFGTMLENSDAQLAAVVNPKFKLDWVDNEHQKLQLTQLLKARVRNISSMQSEPQTAALGQVAAEITASKDFFLCLLPGANRQQP